MKNRKPCRPRTWPLPPTPSNTWDFEAGARRRFAIYWAVRHKAARNLVGELANDAAEYYGRKCIGDYRLLTVTTDEAVGIVDSIRDRYLVDCPVAVALASVLLYPQRRERDWEFEQSKSDLFELEEHYGSRSRLSWNKKTHKEIHRGHYLVLAALAHCIPESELSYIRARRAVELCPQTDAPGKAIALLVFEQVLELHGDSRSARIVRALAESFRDAAPDSVLVDPRIYSL